MPAQELPVLLALAFGLGLVHAFDADHVMAVSVMASRRTGWRAAMGPALRWSAGHGVTLLALATLSIAVGLTLPPELSRWSELAVGLVMVGLGLGVLRDLRRAPVHLHFHEHDGVAAHAHWHRHAKGDALRDVRGHDHTHTPVWVGALHGMAGSAPILAVIPVVQGGSWGGALAYLAVFTVGVALSMLVVGGALGALLSKAKEAKRSSSLRLLQSGSALGSIGVGAALVLAAL